MTFIENPRRSPRDKLRCLVRLATRHGSFCLTFTRDFAARGCQLEVPNAVEPGSRVFIELLDDRAEPRVALAGHVAWCTADAPYRAGVEFDVQSIPAASRFFDRLAARPKLCAEVNAPDRLHAAAPLAPAPPPAAAATTLTEDEARVLRALGAGRSVGALVEDLGADEALHALFALLARNWVSIGSPDRRAAERWAPLLERFT